MAARYAITHEAEQDIQLIREYYIDQADVRVARHVLGQFKRAFSFLGSTPNAGHWRDDLTDAHVRFWPVLGYLIVYDPSTQPIGIARVLHASRDLEMLFRTKPPRL
ncbi:type II toxin-antitoxin system RelE/ParE family toxin [Novosphingobium sp.]|uniref:type II toxin-antitoxin system RelE/ParE family toxin n=1 Tax=Novosphingobium sp. TaxID=1874826 RepID=UPI003BAAF4A8